MKSYFMEDISKLECKTLGSPGEEDWGLGVGKAASAPIKRLGMYESEMLPHLPQACGSGHCRCCFTTAQK